jgi:hypothetical protein
LLERYTRPRAAIAALEDSFQELKKRDVLMSVDRADMTGPRGKLLDVVFTLTPSSRFVAEVKAANKRLYDARLISSRKVVVPSGGSRRKTVVLAGE